MEGGTHRGGLLGRDKGAVLGSGGEAAAVPALGGSPRTPRPARLASPRAPPQVSRALGVLSQGIWSRALGLPIERPKSLTMGTIEKKMGAAPATAAAA